MVSAGSASQKATTSDEAVPEVVPLRHWGRLVTAVLSVLALAALVVVVVMNSALHWQTVPQYLFSDQILQGVVVTMELTVLAMLIGIVFGTVLAVMKMSANPVTRAIAATYVWLVRGTPMLVQIIFWFNIAFFIPRLNVGFLDVSTNQVITPFLAALLGLSLNEAAYMAEIVRAGIIAVDRGQHEAALALGYTQGRTMRRIVLPQALRVILPPTGNETIGMLKATSLVSVIGAQDLLTRAQNISSFSYRIVEMLLVATIWYVAVTTVLNIGQALLERRLGRATASPARRPALGLRLARTVMRRRSTVGGAR